MLHLKLFGGFQLFIDGQPINITRPRQRSIIAYLVLRHPRGAVRSSMASALWETGDEHALTNLRGNLHELRAEVPQLENYLDFGRNEIHWKPNVEVTSDVAEFRRLYREATHPHNDEAARAALERALALFEGELFPDCLEEWIVEDREQLHDQFGHVLEQLALVYERLRHLREAILCLRRLLRHDPLREQTYRQLMQLHALVDELEEVSNVYRQCVSMLQREFKTRPSPFTATLYERLLQAKATTAIPTPRLPLIGREAEWQVLSSRWTQVVKQGSHCLLLQGELGIGKSHLIEALTEHVERLGFTVLVANCSYVDQQNSYAPVRLWLRSDPMRSLLRSLDKTQRAVLSQLLPELQPENSAPPASDSNTHGLQQTHLKEALTQLFLSRQTPLLLVLDHLNWCDSETLSWLHSLLLHDRRAPILVVGALCSAFPMTKSLITWQASLRQQGILTEIMLSRFTLAQTQMLAEAATGTAIDAACATYLQRESQGNPLHILELLQQQGKLPASLAAAVQRTLHFAFDLLMTQFPTQAHDLLECIAVLGAQASLAQLLCVSRMEEETLLLNLDLLLHACILREHGSQSFHFTSHFFPDQILKRMSSVKQLLWQKRIERAEGGMGRAE